MDLQQANKNFPDIGFKNIFYILFSYFLFFFITALFGDGYTATISLLIVLFSCSISIIALVYLFRKILFTKLDLIIIFSIFLLQSLIGVFHFITTINTEYFIENITGVDIYNGYYYFDIFYFTYLMDLIAQGRMEDGYLSINLTAGIFHKNYFLAYMVSDLFYFGDSYVLNYMAINILSLFYSGILLSLISRHVLKITSLNKLRTIFYLTILQPLAWIPSHSMRDIFGAFIIIFALSTIYLANSRFQKLLSYLVSIALVFQHRSIYAISILISIFLNNVLVIKNIKNNIWFILAIIVFSSFFILGSVLSSALVDVFQTSQQNSIIGGGVSDRNDGIIIHFVKLIIGPFPWTQYYDGSVTGYASYYSAILLLNASWTLTIIFILFKNIKNIFKFYETKTIFFTILLFGLPAVFSLGGHNLYLLPASLLSIPLIVALSSPKRMLFIFITTTLIYIVTSILFYFIKYHLF